MADKLILGLWEKDMIPDFVIRKAICLFGIQHLRSNRYKPTLELQLSNLLQFINSSKKMAIGIEMDDPDSQLYELPTAFFKLVLGKHLKFSCNFYNDEVINQDDAEKAMLDLHCERSQIEDGHTVLDLGCGWGSLVLYIAQKYKNCQVIGMVNSVAQKTYIDEYCRDHQLLNVKVIEADISTFEMEGVSYDRIFAIEMLEYMRNYRDLLKKISKWMKSDGLLFVQHLCHKTSAFYFEKATNSNMLDEWFTKNFFTGGTMLSANLLLYFQDDLTVVNHWIVNGKHYAKTGEGYLKRFDQNIAYIRPIMESVYGKDSTLKWIVYWRTSFMVLGEMFGYKNGEEWMDSHVLFKKK